MKFGQIINSLLETDLYKFSMGQAIYHNAPEFKTGWSFKCRNDAPDGKNTILFDPETMVGGDTVYFTEEMVDEIKAQILAFSKLKFTEDELQYLASIPWLKESYINHLRRWRPNFNEFTIEHAGPHGLTIETNGTWLDTSMYEIPTLAIVNEVYFRFSGKFKEFVEESFRRTDVKFEMLKSGKWWLPVFSEFGLRRRLCAEAQEYAVEVFSHLNDTAHSCSTFVGTSNVYLAKKYGIKPVGTMAHEWIMCMGQGNHLYNPAYSNRIALEVWIKEYGIKNGIALTDTITTDCFLLDFDERLATLFSGVRHDSGDPIKWGEKIIAHYKKLGIDPMTKTLLFSDSLNFEKADKIARHFRGRAKVAFGIGTYISNDTCAKPLNIVMKVTTCNNYHVAKVSDDEGKGMCKSKEYVDFLKRAIDYRKEYDTVA